MRRSRSTVLNKPRRETGGGANGRGGSASAINAAAASGPAAAARKAMRQPARGCSAPAIHRDRLLPIPNVDADFTYKVLLHPRPSTSQLSMASVVSVAADQGDLDLTGGNILDKFLLQFASDKEPKFRSTVSAKATAAFNDAIAADPNVSWFTSLGYSLTARRVTTSTAGIAIDGAFCRLGS